MLHGAGGRQFDALEGVRAIRPQTALRRRSQYGEVPRRQGLVGGGERLPSNPWWVWVRQRVRRGAQVPRDSPLPGGADLYQPDPRLHRRARTGAAAVLLMVKLWQP